MASSRPTSDLKSLMEKVSLQTVDGVNYFHFWLYDDITKRLEDVKSMDLRDDDVICVGYPRSGNNWALEVINMVLQENPQITDKLFHTTMLENGFVNTSENMEKMPSPRYFSTHLRVNRLPTQAVEKNVRIIFLMRNPKDVLVSFHKLVSAMKDERCRFDGTWNQFFELHMAGDYLWGTWFDHVLAMDAFMKQHPNQSVHIHSFEQMKTEPVAAINRLCSFLGKPVSLAEQIAEVSEFRNMKQALAEGKMKSDTFFTIKTSDAFLRKGEIAGWKDVFTVSQSERFDEAFKEKMAGCRLADYVRDYI